MKSIASHLKSSLLLCALFPLQLVSLHAAAPKTITFDDIPSGPDWSLVGNGYEGLKWYNFGAFNGAARPNTEGYRNGMGSSPNIAFNLGGSPAWLGCGQLFDFHSAWMSAAVTPAMQVRVQGWASSDLLYDTTVVLNPTNAALPLFEYLGVDRVTFTPSPESPFTLDNVIVSIPAHAAVDSQEVESSAIAHSFFNPNFLPFPGTTFPCSVRDSLIDQDANVPGIGVLQSMYALFDNNQQFTFTVSAPPGKKFLVIPPPGAAVRFNGALNWGYNQNGGAAAPGAVSVSFTGLEGAAPDFSGSRSALSTYHGSFGFESIQSAAFSNDLAFTAITFVATVPLSYSNSGALNYSPLNSSQLGLVYSTPDTNDPGNFVYLVPAAGNGTNGSLSLAEALDVTGLPITLTPIGTPSWRGQSLVTHDGVDAAQSGTISNSGAATIQAVLTGPGTLSFWWKVSSEIDKDYLKFFINGVQQTRISGEENWQMQTFNLGSGMQTLKWTYSKSPGLAGGQDRGWVDEVQFTPTTGACSYATSAGSRSHGSGATTGTVEVTTFPGCAWTTVNTNPWVTIVSGASGSGNSTLVYSISENTGPARSGLMTIAGQQFSITQLGTPAVCSYTISPAAQNHGSGSETGIVAVTTFSNCTWTTVNTNPWVNILLGNGSGGGIVIYSVSPNTTALARSGSIRIAAQLFNITQAGAPSACTYVLSPINRTHGSGSSTGLVALTTSSNCAWTVVNTNPWVNVPSGTIGTGDGLVRYVITANASASVRTGNINIGGQLFTLTQLGSLSNTCSYVLSSTERTHGSGSSTGLVGVTVAAGCAWTVANTNPWVNIVSGATGTGDGIVRYVVVANPGSIGRTGIIDIAEQHFRITQLGSSSTNTPIPLPVALDTDAGPLVWTSSDIPWFGQSAVTHDGIDAAASGVIGDSASSSMQTIVTGPGTLTFWWKVSSQTNSDSLQFFVNGSEQMQISGAVDWQSRSFNVGAGVQTLRWNYTKNSFGTIGADRAWVDQVQFVSSNAPCTFAISPSGRSHGPGSATGTIALTTQAGCTWTVFSTNSWITVLSGNSHSGSDTVSYAITANNSASARSGIIRIDGQNFSITQSGATNQPPPAGLVSLGTVLVSNLGHSFFDNFPTLPGIPNSVSDVLVDQDQSSGGGALLPNASVNWDTNTQFRIRIAAPPGMKFLVRVPPGRAARFGGHLWWESTRGGTGPAGSASVILEGLEGASPNFSDSTPTLSDSHGYFGFADVASTAFSNELAFAAVILTGTVIPQVTGHGTENYVPHLNSSLSIYYTTPQTSDPGRFVSIVPRANLTWHRPLSGGAPLLWWNGQTGATHVVECSEDLINWIRLSTNTVPGTVLDCSSSNAPRRFYRIFELPQP